MNNPKKFPILLLATVLITGVAQAGDWQILFNGKDLNGWKAVGRQADFTIVDGAIRANSASKVMSHLMYTGAKADSYARFKNFELELSARSEPNSNSGIFIHTDRKTRSKRLFLNSGYEVQLNSTAKEKRKTGSLYDVVDLDSSPVDESKWFRVNIKVEGKRITVQLNGKQVIDYTEPGDPKRSPNRKGRILKPEGGGIALQAHDPNSIFYFKDIRIRQLK